MSTGRPAHIPQYVWSKIGKNLYQNPNHPIAITKNLILDYFKTSSGGNRSLGNIPMNAPCSFKVYDGLSPIVSTKNNFDELLIEQNHVSRSPSDTYYIDLEKRDYLLRTQSTCHQTDFLRAGEKAAIWTSDVYRRDEIDAVHFPVFHQIDALRLWSKDEIPGSTEEAKVKHVADALQDTLEGLIDHLYGPTTERRWDYKAHFPFTTPSFEVEIKNEAGKWVEVLGCGVTHRDILKNCGRQNELAWALGLGLERLAMQKFEIPDIRLFWSEDPRFAKQFTAGEITKYKAFSKMPPIAKDISFWLPGNQVEYDLNSFFELCRTAGGDDVEEVVLVDDFIHPKNKRRSLCFRIVYRSLEKTLTHDEVNVMQNNVISNIRDLGMDVRG